MKFLENIYSRKVETNRVQYKIFGFKISVKNKFNREEIKKQFEKNIISGGVKYVSFDVFDTLLVTPAVFSTDIFALIAQKVDDLYGIDFYTMRINSENINKYKNIYQIYDYMKGKYDLTEELKNILLNEEIDALSKLSSPRVDIKEFYEFAIKKGKKIIAIADAHLPSDLLLKILHEKGYKEISQVFVSNEYNAGKDDGKLFDTAIDELNTNNILHIGGDINSDFIAPKNKNIKAIHYPKIVDILNCNKVFRGIKISLPEEVNKNVFIGFVLNNYWFNHFQNNTKIFNDLSDFVNLYLAPYLCYITFLIQKNAIIQNQYKKIYFVARDGYLPKKIYDILNNGKYLDSEYFYGSRIAYWTGMYKSVFDLLKQQYFLVKPQYTLEDFINAYVADEIFNIRIKTNYTKDELNITVKNNFERCVELLHKSKAVFETYYNEQKALAKKYYENIFKDEKSRILVYDIGYSGSVSVALANLTHKIIDKIFIHETVKNIFDDNKNQTYTFILKNGIKSNSYNQLDLVLEECCSPLEGTCNGFKEENDGVVPSLEKIEFSPEMNKAIEKINLTAENFAKDLINLFGDYLQYLNVTDINEFIALFNDNMCNSDTKELFKDIIFNDVVTLHEQLSLKDKLLEILNRNKI